MLNLQLTSVTIHYNSPEFMVKIKDFLQITKYLFDLTKQTKVAKISQA